MEFSKPISFIKEQFANKVKCPLCNNTKKIFCYKCEKMLVDNELVPKVDLPVDLIVLKHPKEKAKKSSAWPVQFLSKDATIVENYA